MDRAQGGRVARFALEAPHDGVARPLIRAEHVLADQLDRRRPRQQPMLRPPDLAHAAFANPIEQLVAADLARMLQPDTHAVHQPAGDIGEKGARVVRREKKQGRAIDRRPAETGRQEEHGRSTRRGEQRRDEHLARRVRHDERIEDDPDAFGRHEPEQRVRTCRQGRPEAGGRDPDRARNLKHPAQIEQRCGDSSSRRATSRQPNP
jgi:hypothetical protein